MKGYILLLFILLGAFRGIGQGHDELIYDSRSKLTWNDFQGKPKPADRDKGAEIKVTIYLKVKKVSFWSGRVTYDAYAVAFKDESWVKPEYRDAYSLAHEQLHFDIAHIYAQTLELQLNSLEKSTEQKERVQEMLNESIKAMAKYQVLYDQETRGGNNTAKQKIWAAKINEDLEIINQPY